MNYMASPNRVLSNVNGIDYAYRDIGEGTPPLVLLQHFRGNLDNWDPALIDALATDRRVVTFDNSGVGGSTGATPSTITQMANDAVVFLDAMEFEAGRHPRILDRQLRRPGDRADQAGGGPPFGPRVVGPAGRRRHARLGARGDRGRRRS